MASAAQYAANRANAQHSTGPKSESGKAASSQNAVKHGLTSSMESVAYLPLEELAALRELQQALRKECDIDGRLEEELFQQYSWSIYVVRKAVILENQALLDYESNPTPQNLARLDRLSVYRSRNERAAARAKRELGEVQADRFAANGPHTVLEYQALAHRISRVLPCWSMRKSTFRKSNQFHFAAQIRDGLPLDTPRLPYTPAKDKGRKK
jgi:hypothetical protein